MGARSAVVSLVALAALSTGGCSATLVFLACAIPQPYAREHLWFNSQPGVSVVGYQHDLDEDVHVRRGVELPMPNEYLVQREQYQVVISTPVGGGLGVFLSAQDEDDRLLALEGTYVSRCHPSTPAGLHCFYVVPAEGESASFLVRDSSGEILGSESLTYRIARYGTVWDRDCI
jgi:hypothetical protein